MRTFEDVSQVLAAALDGNVRRSIVDEAAQQATLGASLHKLRDGMRSNNWKLGARPFDLERIIHKFDRRTRQVGFHVLHDWDGIADKVNEDTIPVDVLHYLVDKRGSEASSPAPLAILLDYYFMHLLALLSLRIWDDGDPDANLDQLEELLVLLQGPGGSGQRFAADAETLLLIATSHYELHERGYGTLLEQTRTLNRAHQARVALGHAASMGSHLRFGFEATYGRDTVNMRDDNIADYPWLCFALATLIKEYVTNDSPLDRDRLIEAMLNGLCADARAFIGAPPSSLAGCEEERCGLRDTFLARKGELLADFEPYRPSDLHYSPLCFFFNFSHNVVKGVVIDALLRGAPWAPSLNDLLTSLPRDEAQSATKRELAETLMGYARDNPHRIRGRLRPVIVYDPQSGREAYAVAMRKLREA
ncbi:MAG TPA: hypothetical protein VNJ02_00130 [Vicinamibacterales bacterium]|nr:hypothetical protein [Vicinamibacterales bacterium]